MEKQKVVVDASVAAKWYLEEEFSDKARQLRDSFVVGSLSISVPSLLFYETLNTLRYSRVYNTSELESAATSLSKYGFDIWEPEGELYRETARSSLKYDLSVYDGSYVGLSTHLRIPVFTADDGMIEKYPRARHIKSFKE